MTLAINKTVISGTPRQNSINAMDIIRIMGSSERRPSASKMPNGKETTMPVTAITNVTNKPPH